MQRDQVFEVNTPESNPLASESQDYANGSEVHLRAICWIYLKIKNLSFFKGWGVDGGGENHPTPFPM